MAVLQNNILAGAAGQTGGADAGYQIKKSLRFNPSDSSDLNRTPQSTGNRKVWTLSFWLKRSNLGTWQSLFFAGNSSTNDKEERLRLYIRNDDQIELVFGGGNSSVGALFEPKLRDTSAWYHLVFAIDMNQSARADGIKLYINGVQAPTPSNSGNANYSSFNTSVNKNVVHEIGSNGGNSEFIGGYLADVHFVDGQQLDQYSFGKFDNDTGVWNPIEFTGNHNTAGVTHWRQADSSDAPSGDSNAQNYRTQRAFEDPQPTALVWDHQATETIGLQNITGVTSLRLKLNSVGNAKLAINGGALFSVGNHGTSTSYPPSESQASWYTISNPPSTLTSISATGGGSGTGNWASVWAIEVNGNRVVDIPAGVNGFHLDFDPNAGQVYSSGTLTGSIHSGNPITRAFDGDLTTGTWAAGSAGFELTFPSAETVANSITVVGGSAQSNYKVIVDGTEHTITFPNGSSSYTQEVTVNVSGSFTGVKGTNNAGELRGIRIDGGPLLIDHSAPGTDASGDRNHWTPTNLAVGGTVAATISASASPSGSTGFSSSYPGSRALDASDSTQAMANYSAGDTTIVTVNFNPALVAGSTLTAKIYQYQTYHSMKVNSGSYVTATGSVVDLLSGHGISAGDSITSISYRTVSPTSSFALGNELYYIKNGGNNVLASNVLDSDITVDSPSNYEADSGNNGGNYATLNPLDNPDGFTLSNGNLETTISGSSGNSASSTIVMTTGKWYWENTVIWNGNDGGATGIIRGGDSNAAYNSSNSGVHIGATIFGVDGTITGSQTPSWATQSVEHVIGHALDLDNGEIKFYLNNVLWKTITLPSSTTGWKAHSNYGSSGGSMTCKYNFGQFQFKNTPPTGFKALCTQNFDTPLIEDGSEHFDAVLWTGNGGLKKVGGGATASEGVTATGTGGVSGISSSNPITAAFDGSTSTSLQTNSANISSNAAVLTVTFPSGNQPSYSSSVVVEVYAGSTDTVKVAINGGAYQTVTGTNNYVQHTVASGSGTITEIKVSRQKANTNAGGAELRAIIVDGVQLLDGTSKSLEFSPDFVWSKTRSHSQNHFLFDTVRGAGRSMRINTSTENGPNTGNDGDLISFNTDGFTLGSGNASGAGAVNNLSQTQVAWTWDGGDLVNTFNTSTHDQSQIWSSLATLSGGSTASGKGLVNGFDGTTTTATEGDSNNEYLELPISTTIASGGVRVYAAVTSSNPLYINLYNGSSNVQTITGSNSGGQWYATTYAGPITKIRIERGGRPFEFNAVEVNGKILTDAGLIAVGGSNSSVYDQSETWSSGVTSSAGAWPGGFNTACGAVTNGFNGNTGDGVCATSGANIVWNNPQSTSTLSGTLEFYNRSDTTTYSRTAIIAHAGGTTSAITLTPNGAWQDLGTYTGITTITITGSSPGGGVIDAIKVGGKLLVDAGVSVTNYPATPGTVRANKPAGFSIISFESPGSNTNIPHGLNQKPEFVFTKLRNASINTNWCVFHKDLASDAHVLALDSSYYQESNPTTFNSTAPDSAVIYLGTRGSISESGKDGIAYAFHSVDGFSKFGTYEGSGNSNGPFIYLGFRPAMFMMKNIDGTFPWVIADATRNTYNYMGQHLYPNLTDGEGTRSTNDAIDFLSNGVKIRAGGSNSINQSNTFVYAAWAQNPFKISRAR